MEKCPNCKNGKLKYTQIKHTIRTRHEKRNELNIENLPVKECNVCEFMEVQKKGEEGIAAVKLLVKNEMEKIAKEEQEELQKKSKNLFSIIKRIIS